MARNLISSILGHDRAYGPFYLGLLSINVDSKNDSLNDGSKAQERLSELRYHLVSRRLVGTGLKV